MQQRVDVLYVEDNEDYISFVGRAVKKINNNLVYHYVNDGTQAIEYFSKNLNGTTKLILLDINLPGIDGFELLKKIRSMPSLKYVPVIMFSTSETVEDIRKSYDSGANAYLVKPAGIHELTETLKSIFDFWLSLNCCYN
ncbi:MAG: response regulator [Chitinophagaceae bacterium]